tara:strand:- start:49 stop:357 length:309 start_codon:yes stop_codon:yes gene_type:complete
VTSEVAINKRNKNFLSSALAESFRRVQMKLYLSILVLLFWTSITLTLIKQRWPWRQMISFIRAGRLLVATELRLWSELQTQNDTVTTLERLLNTLNERTGSN